MSNIKVTSQDLKSISSFLVTFGKEQAALMDDFMQFFSTRAWDDPQADKMAEEVRVLTEKVARSIEGDDMRRFIGALSEKIGVLEKIEGLR
ncbi:MAG: hypothetical protein FWD49_05460 [Firmicutes bacterium]|nr:hypothetical protein [Bacillota bacterium]